MMKRRREETLPSPTRRLRHGGDIEIPLDVTVEILKKLPTKSLARCQFVSKEWSSIITMRRDFIDFVMNRSLAQPKRDAYFLASVDYRECYLTFLSSTHQDKETILIPKGFRHYLRGLVCCWSKSGRVVLYNPTTRRSLYLPKKKTIHMETSFIGYDPLEKQYKVLFLPKYNPEQPCQLFTLGETNTKWKSIQGVESHHPLQGAVCINGKIYYQAGIADQYDSTSLYILMSFDVRSEEFHNVDAPKTLMDYRSYLINFQGKLGFVCCEKGVEIWVMETQGWSKIIFSDQMNVPKSWCSISVTSGGEIVIARCWYRTKDELDAFYYDPKQKFMRLMRNVDLESIYPKGRHTDCILWTVPDYVENTMRLY
ncbi:PREDICTED: putative F-box protein At1g32420 [Camelina sativa]|uniref:F-box protein At1g32420 n=1 Tax=Camelina sativa TaxID=90675 RepID=A0ABM0WN23_CAMSA|nr:PREDICTED: putative F-box protein At1g32420 [Camelina sativa]